MQKDIHRLKSFPLRLEPELRIKLEELAKEKKRSLNAEISLRLESSLGTSDNLNITITTNDLEKIINTAVQKALKNK